MFRSASQIDSERTASSLRRIKANWERTADSWFTGSVDSIDRRIDLCERLIHQASQATARLLDRPESAHYMKLAHDLQADHEALTQMRRDLLTAASDREAGTSQQVYKQRLRNEAYQKQLNDTAVQSFMDWKDQQHPADLRGRTADDLLDMFHDDMLGTAEYQELFNDDDQRDAIYDFLTTKYPNRQPGGMSRVRYP